MPYADPEKQRAANAAAMRKKRADDRAYREAENRARVERAKEDPEARRKKDAEWRAANPERAREIWRAGSRKLRAKKKATVIGIAEHAMAGQVVLS